MRIVTIQPNAMKTHLPAVWALLSQAYESVEGGLHYNSPGDLIANTCLWRVVICEGQVVAVTIYKKKLGLKLVALAACAESKKLARMGLIRIIRRDLKRCWMELSEAAERFVMRYCGGQHYMIHRDIAAKVLGKVIAPGTTDYHYVRQIQSLAKEKVLLGTVQLS